jgi:membrane protease YdiL (CAAX protease family)
MSSISDLPPSSEGFPPPKPLSVVLLSLIPISGVSIGTLLFRDAWIALGLTVVGLACAVVAFRHRLNQPGSMAQNPTTILVGVIPGLAAGPALVLLKGIMGEGLHIVEGLESLGLNKTVFVPFSLTLLVLIPFLEELFWRGVVFNSEHRPAVSDFLFAVFHMPIFCFFVSIPWLTIPFIALVFTSWFWRRMRMITGFAGPVISHLIADLSGFTAIWYLIQR